MDTKTGKVIIVTGGAGFVGSNLVKRINLQGLYQVVIIDAYQEDRFSNLLGLSFVDFLSYHQGFDQLELEMNKYPLAAILHMGANADVLVRDAALMMHANFEHSRFYLQYCQKREIPLIYASSSAIYGHSRRCIVDPSFEHPHNVYAWSKWMFDQLVQNNREGWRSKVIGLRFFNIFGLGESHKGKNASLAHRFYKFIQEKSEIELFDAAIQRDYVWVDDVTTIILEVLADATLANGIYNLGSGHAIAHQELAQWVADVFIESGIKNREDIRINKIPMPMELTAHFQYYTQAEHLPAFVKKHTDDHTGKIKNYLQQMIALDYKNQVPVQEH